MTDKKKTTKENAAKAERQYPGIAVDHSNNEYADPALVKERTKTLGNNPRNYK